VILQSTTLTRLAGILIFSTSCFGYIRSATGVAGDPSPVSVFRTDNTGIQFLLNSGVTPGAQSSASGKPVTVISPGSDPVGATRAALATWNGIATANIKFLPLKSTSTAIDGTDNQMVISIGASAADVSAVGGALAVTAYFYSPVDQVVGGVNQTKGSILDSDIILNPGIAFSTDGSTGNDLQSVLTHELGHSLGANHSGLLGASMFQFNTGQRFLSSDDVTFATVAYPSPNSPALATISGAVTAGGAGVPYALLTAFDTTAGVTIGGVTNSDGNYSFQVPPGTYQIYAEPLAGVQNINIYLTSAQLLLASTVKFQTTIYNGAVTVAANGTGVANIPVTAGAATLATPFAGASAANGYSQFLQVGAPVTIPSGQSVDLNFYGAGFDSTLTAANFTVYGKGLALHPTSVRVDKTSTLNGFNLFRVTLDVAATGTPSLANLIITSGSNTISYSGALVIVPPTPTFTSKGVVSSGSFLGANGDGVVSPGGIYTIFDLPNSPNLGPASFVQNSGFDAYGGLATTLAGVSVTFDGVPAPMFLSFGGQLNLQVPFEVAGKASTKVVVNYFGSPSAAVTVPVTPVQPGFFTFDGKAVIAFNLSDHTINTAQNPAARGTFVEIYGTGVGKVSYPNATGQGAGVFPSGYTGNYTYTIGGSASAPAPFGGWTPGSVGLAQWDLQVPANSATGGVPVVVTDASGAVSQPGAIVYVK
jgi:uncharacterized protein (TIGR03437 family)